MDGSNGSNAVTLVWRAKTPEGWRYFPVVMGRNGRIKKGAVMVDGKEASYPDGHFELRFYEGRKTKYANAGTDATEAVNQRDRMQHLGDAKASATAAGVTVNEPEARVTIKKEAARFAESAEDRGAMESAEVNRSAMLAFQLANSRLVYVDEITAESATTFWRYLKKDGKEDRTVYNYHMRLTGFLKFAGVDYKAWNLRAPRFEKKLPNMYSPGEIEGMLAAADAAAATVSARGRIARVSYNKLFINILAKTGLRDQELMHLMWSDIDFNERKLRVTGKPEYEWKIKDYEQRDIPLPADLVEMLNEWRKSNPKTKLVLGTVNDKPNGKFLRALKGIAKIAKVPNATLHRFRRTYCTTLLRGGMDLRTVQMLMGHGDLASTTRYLTPATGEEVRNKIDSILSGSGNSNGNGNGNGK